MTQGEGWGREEGTQREEEEEGEWELLGEGHVEAGATSQGDLSAGSS